MIPSNDVFIDDSSMMKNDFLCFEKIWKNGISSKFNRIKKNFK